MSSRSIEVRLGLDISNFESNAKRAGIALKGVAGESESLGKNTSAFDKASNNIKANAADYQTLGVAMAGIGATMTAAALAVAKTGIEYNVLQQSSRAALGVIMGSAAAANAQMDKLDAFARTSPFSKQVFIEAQRGLASFGVEASKILPYLDAIQNSVAAMGGSNNEIAAIAEIFAKIKSQGKMTARELQQLAVYGIDAATLIGDAMGKTGEQIRKDITSGALGADQALDALAQGMQGRFGGAADAVKDQFEGAIDRVKAAFRDFSSSAMTPFVDPKGGGWLVDWTNSLADMIRYMDLLPGPVKTGVAVLTGLGGVALTAAGGFMVLAPRLLAAKEALDRLSESSRLASGISSAFGALRGAALPVAGALGLAVAAFVMFANHQKQFRADVEEYKATINELANAGKTLEEGATQQALENLTTSDIIPWFQRFSTAGRDFKDVLADAGISVVDFAEAIGHGGDKAQEMQAHLEALQASGQISTQDFLILNEALWEMTGKADAAKGEVQDLADAEAELAGSTDGAAEAMDAAADAVDRYRTALQDLVDWHDRNAQSAQNYYDQQQRAKETMEGLTAAIQENAEAGVEQWSTLSNAATDIKAYRDAMIAAKDANGEAKFSAEEVTGAIGPMIQSWADAALQAGYTDAEVQELVSDVFGLADGLDSLPDNVDIAVAATAQEAKMTLAEIQAELDGLPLETITAIAARDDATEVVAAVTAALEDGVPEELISTIIAQDKASGVLAPLAERIDGIPREHISQFFADDLTGPAASSATSSVDGVPKSSLTVLSASDLVSRAAVTVTGSIKKIPGSKNTVLTATDNASSVIRGVNSALAGFQSKSITLTAIYRQMGSASGASLGALTTAANRFAGAGRSASGGPVFGPGHGTSDSVPTWLSRGEHVWTAREVAAAGGHAAVYALRQAMLGGGLGLAGGGRPGQPMPVVSAPARRTVVPPNVTVFVQNPWTGKEVEARVARTVVQYV